MSDERDSIITPNSKIFSDSSSVSTSASSRLRSPLSNLPHFPISFSSLFYDFSWVSLVIISFFRLSVGLQIDTWNNSSRIKNFRRENSVNVWFYLHRLLEPLIHIPVGPI